MKNLLWKFYAFFVDETLHDGTTAESLRTCFSDKMLQISQKLLEKHPELEGELEKLALGLDDQNKIASEFKEFMSEAMGIPAEEFNTAIEQYSAPKMEISNAPLTHECKCPNLLAGHLNSCNYSSINSKEIHPKVVEAQKILGGLGKDGTLFVPKSLDDQLESTLLSKKVKFRTDLQPGDLIYVSESAFSDETIAHRNYHGPWLAMVEEVEDDAIVTAVVDDLGSLKSDNDPELYDLNDSDLVMILRRAGRPL